MWGAKKNYREPFQRLDQAAAFGDLRFAQLLGGPAWTALPEPIRRRFGKRLGVGQSVIYRGKLLETRMNGLGHVLAQLLRPMGAPLPVERNAGGAPAVVTVTEAPHGQGQFWTRQYNRQSGFPQVIHSMKSFAGPTGLEEGVGFGVGMTLKLETKTNSLLFCSEAYFVTLFGIRLYLPTFLTPGKLVVGHHDLGDGAFDFTLDLVHPAFGELLHQRARFRDMETWT